MVNKVRRRLTSPEVARQPPRSVARPAATYRSGPLVDYIRPAVHRPASAVFQTDFRRVSPRTVPVRHLPPAKGVSFGAWSLPPNLPFKALQAAHTCASRGIRREVLFASRSTGSGSKARRLHFTNRSCK